MRCIVPNCDHDTKQSSKSLNISMLPSEPSKRLAWFNTLEASIPMDDDGAAGICSCHFLPEHMYVSCGRRRLQVGVTLSLALKDRNIFDCLMKPCGVIVEGVDSAQTRSSSHSNNVKACRICLATDCRLYPTSNNLDRAYEALTGLSLATEKYLPRYLCNECAQRLINCVHFRNTSLRTRRILRDVAKNHLITVETVKSINRHRLKSDDDYDQSEFYDIDIEYIKLENNTDIQANQDLDDIKFDIEDNFDNDAVERDVLSFIDENVVEDGIDNTNLDSLEDEYVSNECVVKDELQAVLETKPSVKKRKKIKTENSKTKTRRGRKRKHVDEALEDGETRAVGRENGIKRNRNGVKEEGDGGKENLMEANGDGEIKLPEEKASYQPQTRHPLDRKMFTVTELTVEQQIAEVEARRLRPEYAAAKYKCTVCYRVFLNKKYLDAHLVKHHEVSGKHVCVICRVRSSSANMLRKHMTATHTRQYSCNVCGFVSRHRQAVGQHQNYHAGIIYRCPHCPMYTDKYTTYQNHQRLKHASTYVCAICGFMFNSGRGLNLHKKLKHRMTDARDISGPYCETCDVRFMSQEAYDRHLKLSDKHGETNERERCSNDPQKVGVDQYRSRLIMLARRTAIRKRAPGEGARAGPVDCEQCGQQLKSRVAYALHFKHRHPGANRTQFFQQSGVSMCELCGLVLRCNALLLSHMWERHGVGEWRPRSPQPRDQPPTYECPVCERTFNVKFNYQRHVFKHTGLRPYKCEDCPKSFKTYGERETHHDHVHLKKPWPKRSRAPGQEKRKAVTAKEPSSKTLKEDKKRASVIRRKDKKGASLITNDEDLGEYDKVVFVLKDDECLGENNEEASMLTDEEQDLERNEGESELYKEEHELEENEGASMLTDEEQNLERNAGESELYKDEQELEEIEGASMLTDEEQDLERNEGESELYKEEHELEENEGASMLTDEEQDLERNEGESEHYKEEQELEEIEGDSALTDVENNEGVSVFYVEEEDLGDETCETEIVWDNEDTWFEKGDETS